MDADLRIEQLLARLETTGPVGASARDYLAAHRVRVGFHTQPTGARWTVSGNIELNPSRVVDEAYALNLIVHEVRHLRQGILGALSVRGELEAWQEQFVYLKLLTGRYSADSSREANIAELMSLSLDHRGDLQRARALMQEYAGKKYRIDLLPLYPLGREILFWTTGKV